MNQLSVTVYSREGIVFQGPATALSGKNTKGVFDVLPQHMNFVTNLLEEVVIHASHAPARTIPIPSGVLWAREGYKVDVYIGIGVL